MTINEFRALVSNTSELDWLKGVKVTISFPHINFEINLEEVSSIYEFVNQQIDGWTEYGNDLPDDLKLSRTHFLSIREQLLKIVTRSSDVYSNKYHWEQRIKALIQQHTHPNNRRLFTYNCAETEFLVSLFKKYPTAFQGAFDYISGTSLNNINKVEYLTGLNLAYEFRLKDYSGIVERRNAEKSSISKIRNDFHEYLNTSEKHLIERLEGINLKFKEKSTEIDETKTEKETLFTEWFEKSKTEFNEFDSESKKKIAEKEALYTEKLRLEAPVEYWNKRSVKLKTEAQKTLIWLLVVVVIACISLYSLLWLTPDGLLLSLFKGDASAVKWSLIFVTYLSFLAYGIRVLARITFSSFHLSRDAEEREQLTYVYLALKRDTTIDSEERKLIMQSIFSRADTGLLKEDSSPTMPGNIAGKIFQNH